MTAALHPTALTLGAEHCWRALDYREAGVTYDRSGFAQGIAAHAVLEALGTNPGKEPQAVAEAVVVRLAGHGRSWDGQPEPPLPIEPVLAGVALGLAEHARNPVPTGRSYEVGIAVDEAFNAVDYADPQAAFRTILDLLVIDEEADEESAVTVCSVIDYKSSWQDRDSALDSLQRKAQAVLADAVNLTKGSDVLRLVVRNLRVGQDYTRDLVLRDSQELLATWRAELLAARAASLVRQPDGQRPASPGPRCVGCPYVATCDDRLTLYDSTGTPRSPTDLARLYAGLIAVAKEYETVLRAALAKTQAVEVDGMSVGYSVSTKRTLTETAYVSLWDRWSEGGQRDARGLLKALGLSVKSVEKAAMILFGKGRDAAGPRREWMDTLTTTRRTAKFGITKLGCEADDTEGDSDG